MRVPQEYSQDLIEALHLEVGGGRGGRAGRRCDRGRAGLRARSRARLRFPTAPPQRPRPAALVSWQARRGRGPAGPRPPQLSGRCSCAGRCSHANPCCPLHRPRGFQIAERLANVSQDQYMTDRHYKFGPQALRCAGRAGGRAVGGGAGGRAVEHPPAWGPPARAGGAPCHLHTSAHRTRGSGPALPSPAQPAHFRNAALPVLRALCSNIIYSAAIMNLRLDYELLHLVCVGGTAACPHRAPCPALPRAG